MSIGLEDRLEAPSYMLRASHQKIIEDAAESKHEGTEMSASNKFEAASPSNDNSSRNTETFERCTTSKRKDAHEEFFLLSVLSYKLNH